jgi:probable rRNA maturation factor
VSRVVDVATDSVRIPVSRARVARVADRVLRAEGVRDAALSITFVTARRIAALNWQHLQHRGPTDVISFGFAPAHEGAPLEGDVYIAPDVARRNAIANHAPVREELLRLVVHGVLHVIGHDHPDGEARYASPMWRRQESLLGAVMTSEAGS